MKFVKRLIIMSGEKAKGTLNLERNAYGLFVRLNAYGNHLNACDLVVRIDGRYFTYPLKDGRDSFSLKDFALDADIDVIHAAIFCANRLVMYGTNDPKRLNIAEILAFTKQIKRAKAISVTSSDFFTKAEYMGKTAVYENAKAEYVDKAADNESNTNNIENESNADNVHNVDNESSAEGFDNIDNENIAGNTDNVGDAVEYAAHQTDYSNINAAHQTDYTNLNAADQTASSINAASQYADDMIAQENFYPPSLSNEYENIYAKKRIREVFEDYPLSEVAASVLSAGAPKHEMPINMIGNLSQSTVAKTEKSMTKDNEYNHRLSPAYMEQIFVLAGLTSKLPKAELPTADRIIPKDNITLADRISPDNAAKENIISRDRIAVDEIALKESIALKDNSAINNKISHDANKNESLSANISANGGINQMANQDKPKKYELNSSYFRTKKKTESNSDNRAFADNSASRFEHSDTHAPTPPPHNHNDRYASNPLLHHNHNDNHAPTPPPHNHNDRYAPNPPHKDSHNPNHNNNSNNAAKIPPHQDRQQHKVGGIKSDPHINARQSTFFEKNGEEIERLFSGEREKNLEQILPSSRWVKINYDSSGKYYVIGLIGKQYLCYGVPAVYTPVPPDELKGYCWWLPLNATMPQGKGYWIMYQSLTTGEAVLPTIGETF